MKLCKEKNHSTAINGAFSLTLSTIIVKLLGVIYKVPLATFLGDEGMGYFNSAYTVYTFFYILCTAGVPKAVMILVSEARAGEAGERGDRIAKGALRLFFILGTAVTVIFAVLSAPLAALIGSSESVYTMLAIAPSIIFISLAGVVRGYLSAQMKFGAIAISQIIEGVGKLALGLIFAMEATRRALPLPMVSALTILGVTLGAVFGLIYLWIASKIRKTLKIARQKQISTKSGIAKRIFAISLPITFSAAVMSITGIIDLLLIIRGLRAVGYTAEQATALYGNYTTLAVPMFNLAVAVISPISIAYLPVFTRAHTKNDLEALSISTKSALELSSFIAAPITVGLGVFSLEILNLLFASSETEIGALLLTLLIPSIFFYSSLLTVNSVLEATGHARIPAISMLVGCLIKLLISYILINNPSVGISGAPIGTVASYALALAISLVALERKCRISAPIFRTSLLPFLNALIAILPTRPLFDSIKSHLGNNLSLIAVIALCAVFYMFLSVLTGAFGRKKIKEMSNYTNFA